MWGWVATPTATINVAYNIYRPPCADRCKHKPDQKMTIFANQCGAGWSRPSPRSTSRTTWAKSAPPTPAPAPVRGFLFFSFVFFCFFYVCFFCGRNLLLVPLRRQRWAPIRVSAPNYFAPALFAPLAPEGQSNNIHNKSKPCFLRLSAPTSFHPFLLRPPKGKSKNKSQDLFCTPKTNSVPLGGAAVRREIMDLQTHFFN